LGFAAILRMVLYEGRVHLYGAEPLTDEDRHAAEAVVREFEEDYRLDFPGQAPELSLPASLWAAEMFYGAALALTFREIDEAGVEEMLSRPFSARRDASAHYSVDLIFRLLPDLQRRARAAWPSDPLLKRIQTWTREWPLSSVGIREAIPERLDEILNHEGLRALYIDRIIAAKDLSRLDHPDVKVGVQTALGIHHFLAPEICAAIAATENRANHE
jgi:hypothetical protein